MHKLLFYFFLTLSTLLQAAVVAKVQSCKGIVKVKASHSIKKRVVKVGMRINSGDMLISSKASAAELLLSDNSSVVLDAEATLRFASLQQLEQKKGKIFYKITSRDAKNSLKVKTPFAIIGIKGTTFIVNASQNASVSLKEGLLGITSINKEFKLYKEKLQEEFEAFKKEGDTSIEEQKDAFEAYKRSQGATAKFERVKSFHLQAGKRVSFSGAEVKEKSFSKEEREAFSYFARLRKDMQ